MTCGLLSTEAYKSRINIGCNDNLVPNKGQVFTLISTGSSEAYLRSTAENV